MFRRRGYSVDIRRTLSLSSALPYTPGRSARLGRAANSSTTLGAHRPRARASRHREEVTTSERDSRSPNSKHRTDGIYRGKARRQRDGLADRALRAFGAQIDALSRALCAVQLAASPKAACLRAVAAGRARATRILGSPLNQAAGEGARSARRRPARDRRAPHLAPRLGAAL